MKKYFIYFGLILVLLLGFTVYEYIRFSDENLRVFICDVGQGDAIFITTPAKTQILIDGGPDKSVLDCLGDNMPFWDKSIDVVIITHPDSDHYGGLIGVVDRYKIGEVYSNGAKSDAESYKLLEAKLADKNLSAKNLASGDNFKDKSGANLKIISPNSENSEKVDLNISKVDKNEFSVVAILTFGQFSVLLTGDAESDVITNLTRVTGNIDVLKVSHHGSKESVSDEILKKLDPEIAVISAGENNRFGHPHRETINILKKESVEILRTDMDGVIEIKTDGNGYEVLK